MKKPTKAQANVKPTGKGYTSPMRAYLRSPNPQLPVVAVVPDDVASEGTARVIASQCGYSLTKLSATEFRVDHRE